MSRDVSSAESGIPTRVESRASWKQLKKFGSELSIFKNYATYGNWISLMLCVTSISIDPLFFYIPVVDFYSVCMDLDTMLGIIAFALRSAVDLIYVIHVYFQRRNQADNNSTLCCPLYRRFKSEDYIDLLAVLPLPQVVVITFSLKMGIISYYNAMNVLKYFVFFQFVPRVIRIYPLLKEATGTFDILGEVTWAKAAFNLYLYLLSGYVFGALWYFYAIAREIRCWDEVACKAAGSCNFDCPSSVAEFQDAITNNCSAYKFGIYKDVLLYQVTKGDFVPRFMYSFRWGLQSLSCLAQNLEPSADTWENIFTVIITIASLVLFVFLIGNMQLYIQSGTSRSEEMKQKMREIEQWKPFKNLPKDLQQQVKKHQLYVWRETKGADVENFLNNLPKDLRRNIKSKLCSELLKKVPNFKSKSDQDLNAICERLKHVLYLDETYIVRKNDPVDEMLFIKHGKLFTDEISNDNDGNFVEYQSDFCGGELFTWAQENCPCSSNLPISTKNIKTVTEVEAFALAADDLKDVFTSNSLTDAGIEVTP